MQEFKIIELKAKKQVYTILSGNHLSKLYGEGYDFGQLREYQIGDDIRKINWTITAKMQKPFVKDLYSNRELSVVVISLISPTLYFGLKDTKIVKEKINTITEISLLLGYSTNYNQDIFTGICYYNNKANITPPSKNIYNIEKFSKMIYNSNPLNSSLDYSQISIDLFNKIINRSLLFIIGDFLDYIDLSILSQRHEIVVIIIRHKEEDIPKPLGELLLQNPENRREKNQFFGKRAISEYLKNLKKSDNILFEHFAQYNIKYIKIYTEDNIVERLMQVF